MVHDDMDFIERTESVTERLNGRPIPVDEMAEKFALYGLKKRAAALESLDAELNGEIDSGSHSLRRHAQLMALRKKMGHAAIKLAQSVDYVNAGTMEFLVDNEGAYAPGRLRSGAHSLARTDRKINRRTIICRDARISQSRKSPIQRILVEKPTPIADTFRDDQRSSVRSLMIEMKKTERSQHVANACTRDQRCKRIGDGIDRGAAAVLVIAKIHPQRLGAQSIERAAILFATRSHYVVTRFESAVAVPVGEPTRQRRPAGEYRCDRGGRGCSEHLAACKRRIVEMRRDGENAVPKGDFNAIHNRAGRCSKTCASPV